MDVSTKYFQLVKALKSDPIIANKKSGITLKFSKGYTNRNTFPRAVVKELIKYKLLKRLSKKHKLSSRAYKKDSPEAKLIKEQRKAYNDYLNSSCQIKFSILSRPSKKVRDSLKLVYVKGMGPVPVCEDVYISWDKDPEQLKKLVHKTLLAQLECITNDTWKATQEYRANELLPLNLEAIRREATEAFREGENLAPKQKDKDNYVGIEIECVSKINSRTIVEMFIKKSPLLHKYVRVGSDGSIRAEEGFPYGYEFRIMCKQTEVPKVMNRFFEVLKGNIKVNSSCGLHVHLDMRNRNYGKSFERLFTALPLLSSMVPRSRRSNSYCKINTDKDGWKNPRSDRYLALNPTSYERHRTLEVRLHSATANANKVINWVRLLTQIIDAPLSEAEEPKRTLSSLSTFFNKYSLPADLRNYITRRISKFGKTDTLSIPKELESLFPPREAAIEDTDTVEDEVELMLSASGT